VCEDVDWIQEIKEWRAVKGFIERNSAFRGSVRVILLGA
jgi:hypothetical protein